MMHLKLFCYRYSSTHFITHFLIGMHSLEQSKSITPPVSRSTLACRDCNPLRTQHKPLFNEGNYSVSLLARQTITRWV